MKNNIEFVLDLRLRYQFWFRKFKFNKEIIAVKILDIPCHIHIFIIILLYKENIHYFSGYFVYFRLIFKIKLYSNLSFHTYHTNEWNELFHSIFMRLLTTFIEWAKVIWDVTHLILIQRKNWKFKEILWNLRYNIFVS